jgi:hypothetical protein
LDYLGLSPLAAPQTGEALAAGWTVRLAFPEPLINASIAEHVLTSEHAKLRA